MGRRCRRGLVWAEPGGVSKLRRSLPCSLDRSTCCSEASCRRGRRSQCPRVRACERSNRSCAKSLACKWQFGTGRPAGPRSDGADRRPRHARERTGQSDLGARCAAYSLIPIAACASGQPRCSLSFRPRASRPPTAKGFEHAAEEYINAQRFNADRPEARSALGSFLAKRGRPVEAEAEYKAALRLSPQFTPAAVNLADLYRALGREADGESVLRAALATFAKRCRPSLRAGIGARAT